MTSHNFMAYKQFVADNLSEELQPTPQFDDDRILTRQKLIQNEPDENIQYSSYDSSPSKNMDPLQSSMYAKLYKAKVRKTVFYLSCCSLVLIIYAIFLGTEILCNFVPFNIDDFVTNYAVKTVYFSKTGEYIQTQPQLQQPHPELGSESEEYENMGSSMDMDGHQYLTSSNAMLIWEDLILICKFATVLYQALYTLVVAKGQRTHLAQKLINANKFTMTLYFGCLIVSIFLAEQKFFQLKDAAKSNILALNDAEAVKSSILIVFICYIFLMVVPTLMFAGIFLGCYYRYKVTTRRLAMIYHYSLPNVVNLEESDDSEIVDHPINRKGSNYSDIELTTLDKPDTP